MIGRTAGTGEGFNYSDAMVEAGEGGLVWNDETLHAYLENPKAMVPGTKMVFAGLKIRGGPRRRHRLHRGQRRLSAGRAP